VHEIDPLGWVEPAVSRHEKVKSIIGDLAVRLLPNACHRGYPIGSASAVEYATIDVSIDSARKFSERSRPSSMP